MRCRPGCGACCIAPSISSPIPGMPGGKPAGIPCVHLTDDRRCRLFGQPGRPAVCVAFRPCPETCGATPEEALAYLGWLEAHTAPARPIRRPGHPPIACSGDVLDASVPAG